MPYPHVIRLRGPWQFEPLARATLDADGQITDNSADLPPAGRATVPEDWGERLGNGFRGRARYRRAFNPPATLDPHERLWLVVEGVDAFGHVSVNGTRLGTIDGYALRRGFEVTQLVGPRNEIELEIELPAELPGVKQALRPGRERLPGGPIGEVRLEVRTQWFLEPLAIWSTPASDGFLIRGQVQGEPLAAALAVVVSGCEREIAYLETQVGAWFEILGPATDFPVWTTHSPTLAPLEVKLLIGGMAVWQAVIDTALRGSVANAGTSLAEQILPDAAYQEFDRNGRTVIQRLPLEWAEPVCSRLAHHPSVVGWSALAGQLPPPADCYGRPWLESG
ncbi:MAG: hypothetical protein B7Z73_06625 [Planctomycetia bacterium 21-64-5]|nr:MAG: hypothetical protein B7Z73_06625 [Planctomycetia bacterium 21-64-5]HQU45303.1 hypothetical protein [Pirellulales bacterium]